MWRCRAPGVGWGLETHEKCLRERDVHSRGLGLGEGCLLTDPVEWRETE